MKQRSKRKPKTVEEYLSALPAGARGRLRELREAIRKAAPRSEELISYGIPAFKCHGMLVWYAAFSKHIGFYPRTSVLQAFKRELAAYPSAKGSVRFPLDKPLPLGLVGRIVKFRVRENRARSLRPKPAGKTGK